MPGQIAVFISAWNSLAAFSLRWDCSRATARGQGDPDRPPPEDREALLSIFSDPDKFTAAAPYVFLVASLIVLLFGPGIFSVDALANKVFWKTGTQSKTPG
jgi:hypothetical protein